MLGRLLEEKSHQWFYPALSPECYYTNLPGKTAHWYNSGVKIIGVTNCFRFNVKPSAQEHIHDTLKAGEVIDPRRKTTNFV